MYTTAYIITKLRMQVTVEPPILPLLPKDGGIQKTTVLGVTHSLKPSPYLGLKNEWGRWSVVYGGAVSGVRV